MDNFSIDLFRFLVHNARMEYAFLFVIAAVLGGGTCGSLVAVWGLKTSLYRLECELEVVKEQALRHQKRNAAAERWAKPEREALELARAVREGNGARQPMADPYTGQPW